MKAKILELVEEKYKDTSLGFPLVQLANSLNLSLTETKNLLIELHKEKKIVVRNGVNDKLIYKK